MFQIAPNFDEHPRINEVLADEQVPPDARIDLLSECTLERDWEEAEDGRDENAWDIHFGE